MTTIFGLLFICTAGHCLLGPTFDRIHAWYEEKTR